MAYLTCILRVSYVYLTCILHKVTGKYETSRDFSNLKGVECYVFGGVPLFFWFETFCKSKNEIFIKLPKTSKNL